MYDPDDSTVPWTAEEYEAVHRPRTEPPKIPRRGARVLYRDVDHGDVTDATVIDVGALDDETDPNLWAPADPTNPLGPRLIGQVRHDDPWPWLTLQTIHGVVRCKEARARGSAGWLPKDWEG